MEDPKIQLNPNASMQYEITVNIEGLPGHFDKVAAFANYQVSNEGCVPITPISGVKIAPIKQVNLDIVPVSDVKFRISVFADRMLDEDYFGRGTCHWSMVATTFVGTKGRTSFVASLDLQQILARGYETTFYASKTFEGTIPISDTGFSSKHPPTDKSSTFSISLSTSSSKL